MNWKTKRQSFKEAVFASKGINFELNLYQKQKGLNRTYLESEINIQTEQVSLIFGNRDTFTNTKHAFFEKGFKGWLKIGPKKKKEQDQCSKRINATEQMLHKHRIIVWEREWERVSYT